MSYCILPVQGEELFSLARSFVLPHEKYCCSLMQKIIGHERSLYLISRAEAQPRLQDIAGVFCFTDGELLLPCLPFRGHQLDAALSAFFAQREVFCISGEKHSVRTIMRVLRARGGQQIKEEKKHFFMEFRAAADGQPPLEKRASGAAGDCTLVRCAAADANGLMPLQLSYKTEEVLPPGVPVNPASERLELDRALRTQTVFALRRPDGSFAAKAQTNAVCAGHVQIGGVFTRTSCRGHGYASFLVHALAENIVRQGKSAVLFVNRRNTAALRAYRNAGFSRAGTYLIVYYEDASF